ncbi:MULTISPECIES: RrF2 family transcriptional regulator [Shouchella]|uniref:HTH-type transcriptional regulator n=3 Tax=Bacillaceae TaxID=186817 RepID=A0A060LYF9_9BACI|nr:MULTISPECIES: Rrf2 family transcriptional regulator [Bacillaceae]RQW22875.1 Rrf2 family transcriptional regulator [Bacillus sp. C1-1]AIC93323.1 HTH-type transcriptional regulator [Shouchella lehensis G1]KQL56820.1 Rrf2 family transcriptional regulator [Alkalicoccobacillus plakortidis]MBG9782921.1 Rrf2 family transcriptional regulator [Shouchella lehensis]TES49725.1 Rrf2 family transcriptional regulator [Shouchella lehensis]
MKYSKATNYALHTMVYLTTMPRGKATGVDVLAKRQDVSPTYLSKILTKLVKAGLIESTPGVNGGYSLSRNGKQISFLDIIHAIEGQSVLFRCSSDHEDAVQRKGCLIEKAMSRAEDRLKEELDKTTIADIANEVEKSRG